MAIYLGKNKVSGIGGQGVNGTDTSDANATKDDLLIGTSAYVNGELIEGTIQRRSVSDINFNDNSVSVPSGYYAEISFLTKSTVAQATPTITIDQNGLITASSTQTKGYVDGGTETTTKQLDTKAASTITPSSVEQSIDSGIYLTGTQTILGDSNLTASNIKSGVSIFGIEGNYSGEGVEAYLLTSLDDKFSFSSEGNLEVWGVASQFSTIGMMSYKKTLAFHGTSYTSSSYSYMGGGSQNVEDLTLSLNADGTLSGLPNNITNIQILVMKRN